METQQEFEENIKDLREMAKKNMQLYIIYMKKADAAIAEFTELLHKRQAETFLQNSDNLNNIAVSCIMEMHSLQHKTPDILDLHLLQVHEAVACLDHFLDTQIMQLRNSRLENKDLKIITRRGVHSRNGLSIIKTISIERFEERLLRTFEINSGCFEVEITDKSLLTSEFTSLER